MAVNWWQFLLTWLAISCVPYGMYLVAWVFESRVPGRDVPVRLKRSKLFAKWPQDTLDNRVPIWLKQSRAYMPGDFGLALAATVGVNFVVRDGWPWLTMQWWWDVLAVLFVGLAVFVGRRVLYNPNDYNAKAWHSPSKRYHDYVMYGFFPLMFFIFIIPTYARSWELLHYVGAFGVAVWLWGLLWYDTTHMQVPNPHQHPSVWKPLWKKS